MKRGGFEEVSRLPRRDSGREAADTTVSAEEYATRKAPKRRLRRMKRGGFEEVSRLPRRDSGREAADTTVSAEEYATRLELASRHPTNGRAIRGNPASPLDLTRFAQVEAASSNQPAAKFQKETPSFRMVFLFGAGDEARTRYLDLGKVALYQMSYARKRKVDYSA